ncbi:hypothetical protein [Moheibacter sediminis]|uniref:Uncharacterized protein n=1 Tax=Moheibacter sediminis TaxID=1434700 RepID=A0A1W2ADB5_9FLAO|nr:hypothetical protein [Moheibacter sediminis]SMC58238.1 hypothetical protein SAMN06296427_10464 [Moheibacter sediminis]
MIKYFPRSSDKNKILLLVIVIFCIVLFFLFRKSESQRILEEKLVTETFDFENFSMHDKYVISNRKNDIQNGFILLKNGEKVKFWFLSHHLTSDDGGTIYEFQDGEQIFCEGTHCCEVQYFEFGKNKREELIDSKAFRAHVKKYDGSSP